MGKRFIFSVGYLTDMLFSVGLYFYTKNLICQKNVVRMLGPLLENYYFSNLRNVKRVVLKKGYNMGREGGFRILSRVFKVEGKTKFSYLLERCRK